MRIPSIDFERERGELQMLLLDSAFNPVLHSSEESLQESKKRRKNNHYNCKCGETNPANYYHYTCRATGRRNPVGKCKKCYSLKNKKRYLK